MIIGCFCDLCIQDRWPDDILKVDIEKMTDPEDWLQGAEQNKMLMMLEV